MLGVLHLHHVSRDQLVYRAILYILSSCPRRTIERYFSRALSVKLTLLLTFQRRVDELLEAFLLESSEILHEAFQQARR
jgi:hypothetical protein